MSNENQDSMVVTTNEPQVEQTTEARNNTAQIADVATAAEDQVEDGQVSNEEGGEPEPKNTEGKPQKLGGFQRKLLKKEQEIQLKDQELAYWKEKALSSGNADKDSKTAEVKNVASGDVRPVQEDFDTLDEYVAAVTAYEVKKALSDKEAKAQQDEIVKNYSERVQKHAEKINELKKQTADFDEKYESASEALEESGTKINPWIEDAIIDSENSAALVYELMSDTERLVKICKLPAILAVKEIGKIEASLGKQEQKQKPKTTSAPTPPTGVKGSTKVIPDPDSESLHDYAVRMGLRKA